MNVTVYRLRMNKDRLVKHLREEHGWVLQYPNRTTAATLADDHRLSHTAGPIGHEHVK